MNTETSISSSRAGYVYAFLCTLCASTMIVLVKWTQQYLPPFTVIYISLAVAGAAITGILFFTDRLAGVRALTRRGWAWLAGISTLTFFGYWFLFKAIHLLDPTVATFIGRVEVLITLLLGVLFLGERFNRIELLGGALILAGMVIIRYAGGVNISTGFFYCLAGAVCWGVTEGLSKVAVRHVSPLVFAWGRCVLLVPAFFFAAVVSGAEPLVPPTTAVWLGLVGLALSGPVLGRYLYMKSLTLIPVSRTALINQFQPVWVALFAGLFLGTLPAAREWIGGALLLSGCVLLVPRNRRPRIVRGIVSPPGDRDI